MSINVLCEKVKRNDYVLKWEIFPEPSPSTNIDIYTSDSDSSFSSTPAKTIKADDFITVIQDTDSIGRMFFKVKVNNTTSGIITNRFFPLDSVQNFRDIGGYYTSDKRQVRWGMVYRSGAFTNLTARDKDELVKLGINTILDMRTAESIKKYPVDTDIAQNYANIPIGRNGFESVTQKILEDRFLRGDAIIFSQDMYRSFAETYSKQYAKFFEYLCDENNYPIVFNCMLGKDQSGLAAYLLLYVLGVPVETAEEDYMLSREGIKRPLLFENFENVNEMSESKQEVLTMISSTDLTNLRYGLSCIKKKYGSLDNYIENELGLTHQKQERLRNILLYKYRGKN